MRPTPIVLAIAAVLLLAPASRAVAQPAPPLLAAPVAGDRVDMALNLGANFLIRLRDPQRGCINDRGGGGRRFASNDNPMTALAVMALASIGHQPVEKSTEGITMRLAIDYLLQPGTAADGYFGVDGSRMYGHGITTLALTEMLGMGVDKSQDKLLRERCQQAIDLILRAQRSAKFDPRHIGGWRYEPGSNDSDLSITVWQLMALRSAQNAGLSVPKQAIDRAVTYVKRSYFSPRSGNGVPLSVKSGFGYEPGHPHRYASTAAGLLSLQVCGQYDAPEVAGASAWLADRQVTLQEQWVYYGTYYYSIGMQKRGGAQARLARETTEKLLLAAQSPDGSWSGNGMERDAGRVYCTSLAMLSLAVRNHYLPIYQH
jgi:hypothetical protein